MWERKTATQVIRILQKYNGSKDEFLKQALGKLLNMVRILKKNVGRRSSMGSAHGWEAKQFEGGKSKGEQDMDRVVYDIKPLESDFKKIQKWSDVQNLDPVLKSCLHKIDQLDFDVFDLRSKTSGNELVVSTVYIMQSNDYFEKLNISKQKFINYAITIQGMYNPIPYHNKTHATDVMQTSYHYIEFCDCKTIANMTELEQAVLLISAMVHDTDHPGFNNPFMVNTKDKLALRYNDRSVLENHHIAMAFDTMLKSEDTCIYDNFTEEMFRTLRTTMIDLVLATDMAFHFRDLQVMKQRVTAHHWNPKEGEDKKAVMSMVIHLADISNPTKSW